VIRHRAFIYRIRRTGRLTWSGYSARAGDPGIHWRDCDGPTTYAADAVPFPLAYVVEIGREFTLAEGLREPPDLVILGPGPAQFTQWQPEALVSAARLGWFGFRLTYRQGDRDPPRRARR
jgi:hypothetical protein